MDDINLGLYPQPRLFSLGLMTNCGLLWRPCLCCGATLDTFFTSFSHLPPHPLPSASRSPAPLATLAQNWYTSKKQSEMA